MKQDKLNRVIVALKPALVDSLAEAAHDRRPDAEEVRARADATVMTSSARALRARTSRRVRTRWRMSAGGALAMATLVALLSVGVLSDDGNGHSQPAPVGDTRGFLLASAQTAGAQPAEHGSCWYNRTRVWHEAGPNDLNPDASPSAAQSPAFHALTASGVESWMCPLPGAAGMRLRTHGPLDIKVSFPTKEDEAAWRAAGSPPLALPDGTTQSAPSTKTVDADFHSGKSPGVVLLLIGSHRIDWQMTTQLPTARDGLESYLRGLWQEDRTPGANPPAPADFCRYVFQSAWSMYSTPTTPGTRAALYRILADCPSVHVVGRVTDREGRSGVAIADHDLQLVVDEATAQLLDIDGQPGPVQYTALERQGWVNGIDQVPTS